MTPLFIFEIFYGNDLTYITNKQSFIALIESMLDQRSILLANASIPCVFICSIFSIAFDDKWEKKYVY